jgi:hypothetical protein
VGLDIAHVSSALGLCARTAGQARLPQGAVAALVARGVNACLGHLADVRPAAEKVTKMSFLIALCRNFNGAVDSWIGIDEACGFERIDDAKRPVQPAGEVLAFQMRPRQQFASRF